MACTVYWGGGEVCRAALPSIQEKERGVWRPCDPYRRKIVGGGEGGNKPVFTFNCYLTIIEKARIRDQTGKCEICIII